MKTIEVKPFGVIQDEHGKFWVRFEADGKEHRALTTAEQFHKIKFDGSKIPVTINQEN